MICVFVNTKYDRYKNSSVFKKLHKFPKNSWYEENRSENFESYYKIDKHYQIYFANIKEGTKKDRFMYIA